LAMFKRGLKGGNDVGAKGSLKVNPTTTREEHNECA